ncbi:imelysin family protein [Sorangium sp. So ce1000]|uniref:imelysin family protein n=1 Tax=Sorangium sp. So ce1000 TaxID=3133325 RepID=UPI003F6148D1
MVDHRTCLPACLAMAASIALAACGGDDDGPLAAPGDEQQAVLDVKAFIQANLDDLASAAAALQAAAPEPDEDGWSAAADKDAVDAMKAEWKEARRAYEHVEGAIAVLFRDLDVSTDARYDAFIETAADADPFDGEGVTGIHAIERILWSDAIPPAVVEFESGLGARYRAAAFPATEAEAKAFKRGLCARLMADTKKMQSDFRGLALDAPSAFRGVIGSLSEQVEKVAKAATGEEESRYAQYTLADMRANVAAGRLTYNAFQPWILSKDGDAAAIDRAVLDGFERIESAYAALPGDALPPVPDMWSSERPTETQLETPFGRLFSLVQRESDDTVEGSLVRSMVEAADLLGIPEL